MPLVPGGGNLPLPSHLRHLADRQPDGAVQDGIPRSAALDEGRVAGTRPRHSQTDGKIPQGLADTSQDLETAVILRIHGDL